MTCCVSALLVYVTTCFFCRRWLDLSGLISRDVSLPGTVGIGTATFFRSEAFVGRRGRSLVGVSARLALGCYGLWNADVGAVYRGFILGTKAASGDVAGGNTALLFDDFTLGFPYLPLVLYRAVAFRVLRKRGNGEYDCEQD